MRITPLLLAGVALAALSPSPAALAQTVDPAQVEALNRRVQELEAQLRALAGRMPSAAPDRPSTERGPEVTVEGGRLRARSADKAFDTAIRARLHFDYGHHLETDGVDATDGFNVRRAFLGIAGTVYGDWGYEFTANFADNRGGGSNIQAANLTYTGVPDFTFIAGVTQPKLTLEDSTSSNDIPFMERSPIVNTVVGIGGSDQRTAIGGAWGRDGLFAAAYLTGSRTGTGGGIDDEANMLGRLAAEVWRMDDAFVAVGTSAVWQFQPESQNTPGPGSRTARFGDRPGLRVGSDPLRLTRTAVITDVDSVLAYGSDLAGGYGPFWAGAEYYAVETETGGAGIAADPNYSGWYAALGYVVTGEKRDWREGGWRGVRPAKNFGAGGFGAVELAVRYHQIDLSDPGAFAATSQGSTAGEETGWTLGVNWYVNPAIRFMLNYIDAENDRPGALPDTELSALAGRMQFQF